jgi:glyoxylase-like metal-dependent hydrolase (beta-lactamase superfamily II)
MLNRAVLALAGCALASLALGCHAQASMPTARPSESTSQGTVAAPMSAELVKTGLYLIRGGGANTLLRFSANGLVLVDAKLPGNYRALMSQVRKVSKLVDTPVRALILTSHYEDQAGNEAQFAAARVQVIAQENAVRRLPAMRAGNGPPALPAFTYDRDYVMRLGGVEVELKHFGNTRSDGDTVVYFRDLKVVAIGDLYTAGAPMPDYAAGGSLVGWDAALARVLDLDFDLVVPSTGPVLTRADLVAFKAKIDTLLQRASALTRDGVAKGDLILRLRTDDLGWNFSLAADDVDRFYADLRQSR